MADHTKRIPDTNSWFTPRLFTEKLGPFDLDPCTQADRPWDTAHRHICAPQEDGLQAEWNGSVWLNPPYDRRVIHLWMKKMAEHNDGVALVFARTETAFWHEHIWPRARLVVFLRGRVHFHRADGTLSKNCGGSPSALVAYGEASRNRFVMSMFDGKYIHLNPI